jgi:hypothetical protein
MVSVVGDEEQAGYLLSVHVRLVLLVVAFDPVGVEPAVGLVVPILVLIGDSGRAPVGFDAQQSLGSALPAPNRRTSAAPTPSPQLILTSVSHCGRFSVLAYGSNDEAGARRRR